MSGPCRDGGFVVDPVGGAGGGNVVVGVNFYFSFLLFAKGS